MEGVNKKNFFAASDSLAEKVDFFRLFLYIYQSNRNALKSTIMIKYFYILPEKSRFFLAGGGRPHPPNNGHVR